MDVDGNGDQENKGGDDTSLPGQIKKLLTVLHSVKHDNTAIVELEKKKEEFRLKYENYKKLALKEKDEKEAKMRDLDLMKKDKAAKSAATGAEAEKQSSELAPDQQKSANVQEKYENLKIMYNKL